MTVALTDALNNCLINFNRRVNVTDLLQKYELSYEEVHKTLDEYLRQQESKGIEYEKRFLVHGTEKESNTEVYTVVQGEKNLQEYLQRLQQSQASLYSVEIAGGARSPAYALKPVERHAITLQSLKVRVITLNFQPAPLTNGNATSSAAEKVEQKPLVKKPTGMSMFVKQSTASASTSKSNAAEQSKQSTMPSEKKSSPVKKISPESKKISPVESKSKKSASAAPVSNKGINNFFGAAAKTVSKKQEVKGEPDSSSPQKRQNSLKKQAEKIKEEPSTSKIASPPKSEAQIKANTSVQLFAEDASDSSSDEEKKLLERKSILNDEVEEPCLAVSGKRNRIIDSDEEEDAKEPPQKVEKIESSDETEIVELDEDDVQPKSETFLDEEGFVITVKPKKKNITKGSSKKPTKARSPRKTPMKTQAAKSQKSSKSEAAASAKTKQGNIMNFFSKK